MKFKFLNCLPAKISAILLSYLMVVVLVLSVVSIAIMGYMNFYFETKQDIKNEILGGLAQNEIYNTARKWAKGMDLEKYYANKNIYYTISTAYGGVLETNYNGEKYIVASETEETFEYEQYMYGHTDSSVQPINIKIYVSESMKKIDTFSVVNRLIEIGYKLRYWFIVFTVLSVIAIIVLLCFLYCSAGHKAGCEGVKLNYLDLVPFDIYTAVVAAAVIIMAIFIFNNYWESLELAILLFLAGTVSYFLILGYTMSFATRIKTRTLIKNTLIYKLFKLIGKVLKKCSKAFVYLLRNISFLKKTILVLVIVIAIQFIYFSTYLYYAEALCVGWIFFTLLTVLAVLYIALVLQRIKKGGEKIAAGDLEHKIDTKYMYLDFKDFANSLNNINEGMQNAVNERMKSERFKTELITNVSHDIKTPLTSIINYVDLLKKQEIENQTANEYIEVVSRHSARLKKLVEDLVDASKASTGNLNVNITECDVSVLLSQAIGEFDDRLKQIGINTVLKICTDNVKIKADARHLWRVFDNLLSNICKYSMPQTRVYIDLFKKENKAVITFRNISKYELNLSADELMERFVRGDSSRNTEGSGLGLSIAKSLVELQNGSMMLEIDGDLFKAVLEFDMVD